MLYREAYCQHITQIWGVREGLPEAVTSNWDCTGDWELAAGGGGEGRNVRQQEQHMPRPGEQGGVQHVGGSGRVHHGWSVQAVGRVQRDDEGEVDRDQIMESPEEMWEGFK